MNTAQMIVNILLVISALVLIVSVLLQKGEDEGMGAIMGGSGAESFLSRNKSKTLEGKLALITKVSAAVFVSLALLMVILMR